MKLLTLLFYFKNRYNQIKVNLAFLSYITQIQRLPFKMKMMKLCEAEMLIGFYNAGLSCVNIANNGKKNEERAIKATKTH